MNNVDPVANWQMSIQSRQASVEAAERERGLTGLLAAFLRWPSNLREAVGPDRSAQRTAAGVIA